MAALEETLAALNRKLPELAPEMQGLLDEQARLEEAAAELLQEFQQKRTAAEGLARRAQEALAGLGEAGGREVRWIQGLMRSLAAATDAFTQGLRTAGEALAAEVHAAAGTVDALAGTLAAHGTSLREAHQESAQAVRDLATAAEAGLRDLATAREEAATEGAGLGREIEETAALLQGELALLREKMAGLEQAAEAAVEETLGSLRARGEGHEAVLQSAVDDLVRGKEAMLGELKEHLEEDVHGRVGAAIDDVALALDALADEARGAMEMLAGSRRELESELEGVDQAKAPLGGAVAQVKVAAERVGIRWA
jgi:chromosome segregation ATPase